MIHCKDVRKEKVTRAFKALIDKFNSMFFYGACERDFSRINLIKNKLKNRLNTMW